MSVRKPRPIFDVIDGHHHFWNLSEGHYPWLQDQYRGDAFFLGNYQALRSNYLPEDYRKDTHGYRIVASVHIEAERSRLQQVEETLWLHGLQLSSGLPSVIVPHINFTQPDLLEILAAHCEFKQVRGIRSKPITADDPTRSVRGEPGTLQDPKWLDGLAQLENFNLSWDLRVPFWHLEEAAEVARLFPRLPIALNHTGLPLDRSDSGLRIWRRGMEALADSPNVYVKLSELGLKGGGWDALSNKQIIRDAVSIFGTQRALFASNLPVSRLSASFEQIFKGVLDALSELDDQSLQDIFASNARSFYRI